MKLTTISSTLAAGLLCAMSLAQMGGYGAPKPTAADKAHIVKLEKEYDAAKAAFAKSPKNPKARQRFVDAGVQYGHESMVSPVLDRKIKYRQALRVYREVLKVDPKNPVAKQESDLIVSIYKSMHRPIPN